MSDPQQMPEPPNGAYVELTPHHHSDPVEVMVREDFPDDPDDPHRWHLPGVTEGWLDWRGVLLEGTVQRLWRESELVEQVGEHRITPEHYCQTCGVQHSPTEVDRLRAAEGGSRDG